jgi:hypothetical protein
MLTSSLIPLIRAGVTANLQSQPTVAGHHGLNAAAESPGM